MPTLREMMKYICDISAKRGVPFGDQCAREMEQAIRKAWPSERVYIPPANTKRDPARTEEIRNAARTLPTSVVAERFGVSRRWVNMATRKKT